MNNFFKIGERGSTVGTEVRAGITTFLAMAYIIAVNPALLSAAGGDWKVAMAVIFLEGLIILALVLCGLREAIMEAVPVSLRHAIAVGLGIFIALLGLINGGIVVNDDSTLITFGSVYNPVFLVGIISVVVTFALYVFKIKGYILWGIIIAAVAGVPLGVTPMPTGIVQLPDFTTFMAPFQTAADGSGMAIVKVFVNPTLLVFVFSIMLSDFFDTMGTAVAVGKQGDFLDEDGNVKDIRKILIVDSLAASVGGLFGASSCTTFVESASGAADGGRTGLTSVVTGVIFLLAAFFSPLVSMIAAPATCGALVMVGFLMMNVVSDIDFSNPLDGIPAFMTIIGIPLTYSIATGIGLGFITYTLMAVCTGNASKVKPLTWLVDIAFLISFLIA